MAPDVFIDTETTGLSAEHDAVIEVGVCWRDLDGDVQRWGRLCNPGPGYIPRAQRTWELMRRRGANVTLTPRMIANAPSVSEASLELSLMLADIEGGVILRAFNNAFDRGFLAKSPWLLGHARWGPCVMQRTKDKMGRRMGLGRAMNALEIPWPEGDAHRADSDAHATLLLAEALGV